MSRLRATGRVLPRWNSVDRDHGAAHTAGAGREHHRIAAARQVVHLVSLRPCLRAGRRANESKTTAVSSTPPVIMNWTAGSTPSSAMPEAIDWMMSTPSSADQVEPRPPNRLVPPMTAAAMALISSEPEPGTVVAEESRDATNRPPTAARVPDTRNTQYPHARHMDAGPPGRFHAAAQREDLTAVGRAAQKEVGGDDGADEDQERERQPLEPAQHVDGGERDHRQESRPRPDLAHHRQGIPAAPRRLRSP
ncbi:hypothetical protein SALBM311S_04109 [Streptomyces alboniger]